MRTRTMLERHVLLAAQLDADPLDAPIAPIGPTTAGAPCCENEDTLAMRLSEVNITCIAVGWT